MDQLFNEVDVISQVRHKSLVKLLGCSMDGPESFLIYEYHFNRSLDLFIFGKFKFTAFISPYLQNVVSTQASVSFSIAILVQPNSSMS
jgi:hypothetical protein